MKCFYLTVFFSLCLGQSHAQKKPLSHQDYDIWSTLKNYIFTDNGQWMSYESIPYRGDGYAILMKSDSTQVSRFERMSSLFFSVDGQYFAGLVKPQFDTLRKLELDKVKKDKWPKDTLVVHLLEKDSTIKIAKIIDSKLALKGSWIAYRNLDKAAIENALTNSKKKCRLFKRKRSASEEKKTESDGKVLVLWNPLTGLKHTFDYVTAYDFSDSAKYLSLVTHDKRDKKDYYQLNILTTKNAQSVYQSDTFTSVGKWTWDKSERYFAFLASKDTNSNNKHFSLYHLELSIDPVLRIVDSLVLNHPEKFIPSNFGQLAFAEDDNRLFFGIAPKPTYDAKDTLTKDEKVALDIWHWEDKKLQPRQLLSLNRDKNSSWLTSYDWEAGRLDVLENDTLRVRFNSQQTEVFLAYSDDAYAVGQDYSMPWVENEYLVRTGGFNPQLIGTGIAYFSQFSPDGEFLVSYRADQNQFYLALVSGGRSACLTCGIKENWLEDVNGEPREPQPEMRLYWENDREHLWFLTKNEAYRINIDNQEFTHITKGIGKELKQEFSLISWDSDSLYLDPNRSWMLGFSMLTKETNIYGLDNNMPFLKKSVYADIRSLKKVKDANLVLYRISTVTDYPDLTLDNLDFTAPRLLTNVNSQQAEYNWAKVELVTWKTVDGVELEGLLYMPENLDTLKSYPMIVYYYELNSENIHRHWTPRPTASIVFPTEYASAGYVIFVPDIRYKPGYPAQGAYDCIMSGTDHILAKYKFIDANRMGLQGQSWGGYQSAQLITMTTRYKAAMAGAPVSNMFSAYGGIRWGSGMSRQFQYEHSQSRIGFTIWERPDLYMLNSPIFHLPKVQTPLLIMHNDDDGAVPWYQGIELYMGLRRLQKPVWLLNYNGDEHNLMIEANRRDLSIRMRQFFDFYLMGAEMPDWMKQGVKAVDK